MTKDAALQYYMESFMRRQFPSLPVEDGEYYQAFPSTGVPCDVLLPYMTYTFVDGAWGDGDASMTVNFWFRSESEKLPNETARAFRKYIEENDWIKCDDGYLWMKPGSPWSQSITTEDDKTIKGRYINVTIEQLTR